MFFKISVLQNFANFTGGGFPFETKLQAEPTTLSKKRHRTSCFPVKFKNTFFPDLLPATASGKRLLKERAFLHS